MQRALTSYNRLLETRPILTKMVTTGALFGVGDLLSQQIEKSSAKAPQKPTPSGSATSNARQAISQGSTAGRELTVAKSAAVVKIVSLKQKAIALLPNLDLLRIKRMMLYGSMVYAPYGHAVYSKILPYLVPNSCFRSILLKVGLDTMFVTAASLAMFFYVFSRFEGKDHNDSFKKVQLMLIPSMIASAKIWPSLQMINFKFVPISMQVLFISFVNIFW
eukprot:CAMPEP_0115006410 /NCGR_PEP_ID=MMETSP0216-20121206/20490_1 /TAXON_ID=223996 /ORGANISM="Protocruzia adherens, Strain Boccale" /LENGTH=218 /DNA_ID=CAMNT_0002373001 /DNA_START=150 /DNA_END=803 /DNA_ORIENTATION=-